MAKIHRKQAVARSCFDMALDRLRNVYATFDRVVYAFSGGKDSTVCLQLGLIVAREFGRLPIDVFTFDEEAIPPETVEYLARVKSLSDLNFTWYCLPVKLGNACSRESPNWYPWHPDDRVRWVRPLPATAVTDLPGFRHGMGIPELPANIYGPQCGRVANVLGIRCQESIIRYQSVATKRGFECFKSATQWPWLTKVYPIYDWSLDDVWFAPAKFGWDYNRAYDVMEQGGVSRVEARCSPSFGEQTIRRLWTFKTCWPDLWTKMVDRVPGAATAARYAKTELYGTSVVEADLPAGMTWEQYTISDIEKLAQPNRGEVAIAIKLLINQHKNCLSRSGFPVVPVPDSIPDPVSGHSWRGLSIIATAGGNRFNRQSQKVTASATKTRKKNKLCVSTTEFHEKKRQQSK